MNQESMMDRFASIYQNDFTSKQEVEGMPHEMRSQSAPNYLTQADTEANNIATDTASDRSLASRLSFTKELPQVAISKSNNFMQSFALKMPEEKNMTNACIGGGVTVLLLLMSLFNVLTIVTNPGFFTTLFGLMVISAIFTMASFKGPRAYVHAMFEPQYRVRSWVLVGSMIGSLICSWFIGSWILSLICCILEFNPVLLYFCNSDLVARATSGSFSDLGNNLKNQAAKAVIKQ